jgi:hypothetical protein
MAATARFVCGWMLAGLLAVSMSASPLAAEPKDSVREAAIAQLGWLKSLKCDYEVRFSNGTWKSQSFAMRDDKWRWGTEWDFESMDGTHTYSVSPQPDRLGKWLIQKYEPSSLQGVTPALLLGQVLQGSELSLLDLIEQGDDSASAEDLDGIAGYRITFAPILSGVNRTKYNVSVFLDAQHDFALRQISVTEAEGYQHEGKDWKQVWTVSEFAQVHDPVAQRMRWFPIRAELKQAPDAPVVSLRISNVKVNELIPIETFRPVERQLVTSF